MIPSSACLQLRRTDQLGRRKRPASHELHHAMGHDPKSLIGTVLPSLRRASGFVSHPNDAFLRKLPLARPAACSRNLLLHWLSNSGQPFPRTKLRRNIFDSQNFVIRKIYDIALKARRRNHCYNGWNRNWSNRRLLLALTLTNKPANAFERRWRVYSGHSCNLTWSNCRLLLVFTPWTSAAMARRLRCCPLQN